MFPDNNRKIPNNRKEMEGPDGNKIWKIPNNRKEMGGPDGNKRWKTPMEIG
jgi:hypothetical protein